MVRLDAKVLRKALVVVSLLTIIALPQNIYGQTSIPLGMGFPPDDKNDRAVHELVIDCWDLLNKHPS